MRARSDAVIVGGETVRRDNPRLTTRREGGHMPVRIVMSRTLDLPAVRWQSPRALVLSFIFLDVLKPCSFLFSQTLFFPWFPPILFSLVSPNLVIFFPCCLD
jgi:RibD C-terminal domain